MKVLIFSDKSKAEVISENEKYYITKKSQFRKSNPAIVSVTVSEDEKPKKTQKKPKGE